ncbi:aminotransferase class I/II-fold pyridoxal phosphate-dependent enzyme [Paracoccus sp. (in: a-proteobacteria)]|uniref:aminotransferase class I/II-fold pyridoxal phosphate-dependent enzyme n=1 Tax=Paracoccus sp. TaxID=267 RepID=UPI003A89755D
MTSTLDRLKSSFLDDVSASAGRNRLRMVPEYYDFGKFPEYQEYATMQWYYQQNGFEWNLFRDHLGVSGARARIGDRDMINFSSYNYLGLAGDPRVLKAAQAAVAEYGVSTGSGRAITGEIPLHGEFEREICKATGAADAVLSVGGYSTNAFTIGYLARGTDLIVYDELIHNSALIGSKTSGARRLSFPHNDAEALDDLLAEHREYYERCFVLIEGVYSMDGDIPDLPAFVEVKNRHHALLMVDEAHSMGVIGPRGLGVLDYFPELEAGDIDILFGSLSKAFATCGGYVAGSEPLIAMLKQFAPGVLLYGAAPTPANTAAGLETLRLMQEEPERARRLQQNAAAFIQEARQAGFDTSVSRDSAVVPLMFRSSEQALWLSVKLFEQGICTFPMMYPIVPREKSRLRFFINADHTRDEIDHTIATLSALWKEVPPDRGIM